MKEKLNTHKPCESFKRKAHPIDKTYIDKYSNSQYAEWILMSLGYDIVISFKKFYMVAKF